MLTIMDATPNVNACGVTYLGTQGYPMRIKLEIKPAGPPTIRIIEDCENDNSTPISEWNREVLVAYGAKFYGVLEEGLVTEISETLAADEALQAAIKVVQAHFTVEWDGSNHRGRLDAEVEWHDWSIVQDHIDKWTPGDDQAGEFYTEEQARDAFGDDPQIRAEGADVSWRDWAETLWFANNIVVDVSADDADDMIEIADFA